MEKIDKFLGRWASRKLLVLVIATILMARAKIDSQDWVHIAMVYLSVQGVVDISELIKGYFKK